MSGEKKAELPEGWVETKLGALILHNPKNKLDDETSVGFVPMSHVPTSYLSNLTFEEREWGRVKKGYSHFADGDVLLAKITPCFENGKAAIAKALPNGFGSGSTEYHVLRPIAEGLDPRYLLAFVKTDGFSSDGRVKMTGSVGHKRVPKEFVLERDFPLPPLNEQRRIADKLDHVLGAVERCKARLEKAQTLLKRFRQSTLNAATTGKLTQDWREENGSNTPSSASFLEEILQDRQENWLVKKYKEPTDIRDRQDIDLPEPWIWVSLDQLTVKIVDGTHHTPPYTDYGIPFISVKDVRDGKIYFDKCKYVSPETHEQLIQRCHPENGDLLITKSGTIGRMAVVDCEEEFSLFVSVALLKPASLKLNMTFVSICLLSWINSIDISSAITGTAIKNLHLRDMRVLGIPFPSPEEQHEIVHRVERLFALADRIEAKLTSTRKRLTRLEASLLAKAFRGELVPQDPTDELASELLKRIKAERESTTAKPKRRTKKREAAE